MCTRRLCVLGQGIVVGEGWMANGDSRRVLKFKKGAPKEEEEEGDGEVEMGSEAQPAGIDVVSWVWCLFLISWCEMSFCSS